MDRVPFNLEVDGLSMTLQTWHTLETARDTAIFAEVEKQAKVFIDQGKCFKIYDPQMDFDVYARCDTLPQVEKLFNPKTSDAT
ncbi:hypothetical protein ACVNP3_09925 [Pseudomonas chlororaphis subsp. piscium]